MDDPIKQFRKNIESAKQLGFIYTAFSDKLRSTLDLSEILRAEFVLVVSALDCFIHDLVRMGMSKIFQEQSDEPNAFLSATISLKAAKEILNARTNEERIYIFEGEIRRLHAYETFQSPDNISKALSRIGIKSIWDKTAKELKLESKFVRDNLKSIVVKRNQIAHESDIDPSLGIGVKYPISLERVNEAVDFIEKIVETINSIVNTELTKQINNLNK